MSMPAKSGPNLPIAFQPNEDVEMKMYLRAAVIFVASTLGMLAPMAANAADKVSQSVAKPLSEAQKALGEKDYQTALAKVQEAQAVTDRTPFDDYTINSFLAYIEIQMKDYNAAAAPAEAAADSPAIPDADKKDRYLNAYQLAMNAKHYQKAEDYGQKLLAMNALDASLVPNLALAYYLTNDFAHAKQYAQMAVDTAKAAGKQPDENSLKIVMNSELQQKDTAGMQTTLENLAISYNKPDDWSKLVDIVLGTKGIKAIDELYLLRLKMLVPESMHGEDYAGLGNIADAEGYATEATNAYQKGMSSGKMTAAQAGQTLAHARNGAGLDQRSLPSIATQAEHSKTGEQDIKLAEDYWGYGRYADAEAVARRAISKGGLKDPSEGPMLLGMVLVAEGKYDDAIQTLTQVGGTEARTRTAHLWSVYAQAQKTAQGAAAPAAH
jgi:tetratricopeptide (TPR) repeat protein